LYPEAWRLIVAESQARHFPHFVPQLLPDSRRRRGHYKFIEAVNRIVIGSAELVRVAGTENLTTANSTGV
jgi:hypothetical protein